MSTWLVPKEELIRMRRVSLCLPSSVMLLVSLISYNDRNTLALPAPTILRETRLKRAARLY